MKNPYLKFVQKIEQGVVEANKFSVSGTTDVEESASKVLLFSPHPDDECITGLLPLRLLRELGKQIIDVPVTFGSNEGRRAGRSKELADACGYLGWEVYRGRDDLQSLDAADVVNALKKFQPEIIFMPHAGDWNSRHIATHQLVVAALSQMPAGFSCKVVETEYWGALDDPNLMVEGDAVLVADLVAAISLHVEEISRNPYHLLLPGWMQDNVRRGGELVCGQGSAVPKFSFATLYRLRKWREGGFVSCREHEVSVAVGADTLKEIF